MSKFSFDLHELTVPPMPKVKLPKAESKPTDVYSMVNEFIVKRQREMESAIMGTMQEIAIENGIRTEIVLNEKAITQAILKSQKRKPYYDRELYINCPACSGVLMEKIHRYKPNYCPDCGQALDWEG